MQTVRQTFSGRALYYRTVKSNISLVAQMIVISLVRVKTLPKSDILTMNGSATIMGTGMVSKRMIL